MEGVIWHGLLWNDGKDCFGIIYFGMSGTHEKTQPKSSFRQAWWRYVEMWSPYGFHLIHPGDTCHLPVIYRSFTCHLSGLSCSQVQLQTNGAQAARLEVSRLMGNDQGEKLVGKMGFSQQMLIRMLGEASGRALATIIYNIYIYIEVYVYLLFEGKQRSLGFEKDPHGTNHNAILVA